MSSERKINLSWMDFSRTLVQRNASPGPNKDAMQIVNLINIICWSIPYNNRSKWRAVYSPKAVRSPCSFLLKECKNPVSTGAPGRSIVHRTEFMCPFSGISNWRLPIGVVNGSVHCTWTPLLCQLAIAPTFSTRGSRWTWLVRWHRTMIRSFYNPFPEVGEFAI